MAKHVAHSIASQNRRASGWQAQCEEINRCKARKLRRASWRKRIVLVLSVTGCAYAALLLGWLWHSGQVLRAQQSVQHWAQRQLIQTGLVVQSVTVKGHQKLTPQEIAMQAGLRAGIPMISLSLGQMKAALEAHPQIAHAEIERIYPNQLSIVVRERAAVALWQHEGKKHFVDAQGVVLSSEWVKDVAFGGLPIITGAAASSKIPELLEVLEQEPALKSKLRAAQWVGQRRWNIVLHNNIKILLPAEGMHAAWKQLAALDAQHGLLDKAVQQIDLRIEGRIFLRYEEDILPEDRFEMVTAMLRE